MQKMEEKERLITSLQIIDPLLQFLTKATGRAVIPLNSFRSIIPKDKRNVITDIPHLCDRGVLHIEGLGVSGDGNGIGDFIGHKIFHDDGNGVDGGGGAGTPGSEVGGKVNKNVNDNDNKNTESQSDPKNGGDKVMIGFPPMGSVTRYKIPVKLGLHGSTKAAAKRRLMFLKKTFVKEKTTTKDKKKNDKLTEPTNLQSPSQSSRKEIISSSTLVSLPSSGECQRKEDEFTSIVADDNTSSSSSSPHSSTNIPSRRGFDPKRMDGMVLHNEKYAGYAVKEQHGRIKEGCQNHINSTVHSRSNGGIRVVHGENHRNNNDNDDSDGSKGALMGLRSLLNRNMVTEDDIDVATSKVIPSKNNLKSSTSSSTDNEFILPRQAAYAGSQQERPLRYKFLLKQTADMIPNVLSKAMGLQLFENEQEEGSSSMSSSGSSQGGGDCASSSSKGQRRKLYLHQAMAIESALSSTHTLVCTGTGSGKSLCFLLPILAKVMNSDIHQCSFSSSSSPLHDSVNDITYQHGGTCALIMFPTKALAQDQLSKLDALIKTHPLLERHIRPGIIDGDTPHQNRKAIADRSNIILSNPDTLHAAILPGWKTNYKGLLSRLEYIVIDELHSYEGAFGAHVSLVLSRLYRVCRVAHLIADTDVEENAVSFYDGRADMRSEKKLVFLGCSATIGHPDEHFRLICPIPSQETVTIVKSEDDGSKCAAKHFFVWNPALLDSNGNRIGRVTIPPKKRASGDSNNGASLSKLKSQRKRKRRGDFSTKTVFNNNTSLLDERNVSVPPSGEVQGLIKRNHAAEETAHILAHLVKLRVRSIAFCKTRSLAEWVYERCISILQSSAEDMVSMVEIYRGGYSASIRRGIEGRLFRNELFGVVGTCALELGVDIGGIDVTLHCGYPGSISSVLQQAGRAGRGATANGPSYSITVCFSSPSEQHLWKHPKGLLGRGLSAPPAVPLNTGIVSGHLLCASEEFPLVGKHSVASVFNARTSEDNYSLSDYDLFGSEETYTEAFEILSDKGSIVFQKVSDCTNIETYSKHPSIKKPWSNVSLRSIEPINYSIVDQSHPQQVGTDVICPEAVLDNIPYSRVFYHAYPGAIIIHRGRRYKIHGMNSPPAFANSNIDYRCRSCNLGAFAKPTNARYTTNALSITLITVVKQLHRVEIQPSSSSSEKKKSMKDDNKNNKNNEATPTCTKPILFEPELSSGCLAGNGVVTVKRTVHGYKKLSLVNRVELSRSEISLPPMEYDTNGLWIDTEASTLAELMPDNYDKGVHALSHAIVAVAPLFVPCNSSDIDCDHSHYSCTRILLFDVRAGGAGTCAALWRYFFHPNGVLKAAIDLLSECPLECDMGNYKGGCPGCIQAVPCINFQQDLSRSAGLLIARRMLARIEQTALYQENCINIDSMELSSSSGTRVPTVLPLSPQSVSPSSTPNMKLRQKKLNRAADLVSARKRNIVVGRETWPMDHNSTRFSDTVEDMENAMPNCCNNGSNATPYEDGGFVRR